MKKSIVALLLFVGFINGHAQVKSGVVAYSVVVTENKDSQLEKMMLSMNSNFYSIIKEFEFSLKFNKDKALFLQEEKMYSDEAAAKLAAAKISFLGNVLTKKDTVYREGASRTIGNYIVKKQNVKNWTLSNESKLIDNYLCYKATTENIVVNKDKTFRHPIIAWFCPQIPFPFGPAGYGGLPGLILELQTKDAVYGANKIQLSQDDSIIAELKRYKILEETQLNELIENKNSN